MGDIRSVYPDDLKENNGTKEVWRNNVKTKDLVNHTLFLQDNIAQTKLRIQDSGSSRQLVNNETLLEDARECDNQCAFADRKTIRLTMVGSVPRDCV